MPCKVALGVVLGQSDDPCAPGFGQLHTGRADSAAGTGDQHRFAMFELCTAQQSEVCGGINQPAGGGFFITHTVGQCHHQIFWHHQFFGISAVLDQCQRTLSDRDAVDGVADCNHPASGFLAGAEQSWWKILVGARGRTTINHVWP